MECVFMHIHVHVRECMCVWCDIFVCVHVSVVAEGRVSQT